LKRPAFTPGAFYLSGGTMSEVIHLFAARGDLAHLALLLWAMVASALASYAMRELAAASRRFDDFMRQAASSPKRSRWRVYASSKRR